MSRAPEPTKRPKERVLLCGVVFPDQEVEDAGPLTEAAGLVVAAGSDVVGHGIVQNRAKPDPATLMGRGKVEEVADAITEFEPDAIVVDNDLTPAQVRNLEKAWKVRVVDRSELILDIFARRARTRQAKLQVELAQTEYLMPRLRRAWTPRATRGSHRHARSGRDAARDRPPPHQEAHASTCAASSATSRSVVSVR
ncbi:MAG: hypothetical protein R3F34_16290 [Planctomycetota bacterium]